MSPIATLARTPRTGPPSQSDPCQVGRLVGEIAQDGRMPTPDDLARLRDHLIEVGYTVDGVAGQLGADAHAALARGELVPAIRASRGSSALQTYIQLFLLG